MSTIYTGAPVNVSASLSATVSGATNATPIVITTNVNHLFATGDKISIAGVVGNTAANSPGNVGGTITGATNATPIVVTSSAVHALSTGQTVTISGVVGNTAANGQWTVTSLTSTTFSLQLSIGSGAYTSGGVVSVAAWTVAVLSSTTFSLAGSAGSGAYVSGGAAYDLSLTPQFTIPSDGDARNAASINVALQALGDRTQMLNRQMKVAVFNSTSTWTAPTGCQSIFVMGWGGGGGGGGGTAAAAGANIFNGGGGGGGGSLIGSFALPVVAGLTYGITTGAAGSAGAAGAAGASGAYSAITLGPIGGGNFIAIFPGGSGGAAGVSTSAPTTYGLATPGVSVVGSGASGGVSGPVGAVTVIPFISLPPGAGGFGQTSNTPAGAFGTLGNGCAVANLFSNNNNGNAGGNGTANGTNQGGGGGGGGGGGPGPVFASGQGTGNFGSAGGSGGPGTAGGAGNSGFPGTAAQPNSGGGGGGGGGAGVGASTGVAGAGSAGGSGQITIFYLASV